MTLVWTFAYGSNMDVDDLRSWFVSKGYEDAHIERCLPATLPGYRIIWNYYSKTRRGGAANIEHVADASSLPGLALLMNGAGLAAIDRKEGHPHSYSRGSAPITVQLTDGTPVDAWVYIAVPTKCRPSTVLPTPAYLDIMVKAAERAGLPAEHIEILKRTPTAEPFIG